MPRRRLEKFLSHSLFPFARIGSSPRRHALPIDRTIAGGFGMRAIGVLQMLPVSAPFRQAPRRPGTHRPYARQRLRVPLRDDRIDRFVRDPLSKEATQKLFFSEN